MRKTVLVTGGAGYIGSHACKALDASGYLPVVYDDLSNGDEAAVQWGPLVRGDVRDADRLTAALIEHKAGAVIHFAGHVLEMIEVVARACGRRPTVIEGPPRPGDPPTLLADPARARRRLGWRPAHDLEVIVGTAVAWRQDPAFGPRASGPAGLAAVA